MVWWKSRWSTLRLVKTAAAKRVPRRRPAASPCEETSIATARQPAARASANMRCRSGASGVVRAAAMSRPPYSYWIVPIRPQSRPAARRISRIM